MAVVLSQQRSAVHSDSCRHQVPHDLRPYWIRYLVQRLYRCRNRCRLYHLYLYRRLYPDPVKEVHQHPSANLSALNRRVWVGVWDQPEPFQESESLADEVVAPVAVQSAVELNQILVIAL